jgi:hypothetical protein
MYIEKIIQCYWPIFNSSHLCMMELGDWLLHICTFLYFLNFLSENNTWNKCSSFLFNNSQKQPFRAGHHLSVEICLTLYIAVAVIIEFNFDHISTVIMYFYFIIEIPGKGFMSNCKTLPTLYAIPVHSSAALLDF